MEKKRYILFGFYGYYPSGGMNDALMTFDTKEELIEEQSRFKYENYQVFDMDSFKIGHGESLSIAFDNTICRY